MLKFTPIPAILRRITVAFVLAFPEKRQGPVAVLAVFLQSDVYILIGRAAKLQIKPAAFAGIPEREAGESADRRVMRVEKIFLPNLITSCYLGK
ncbi:hypothetical protein HMSSN036_77550 [Paenibacillus macerans]|nr:hypothetical protein HMSSN036_77550 [Paenibacillus macerans]